MRSILSGNAAVARGAYEAGVEVAAAYPGTPSTEILEYMATYRDDVYSEWSVNEKVAFEIAFGASLGGKRSLAAMKHVGVNVASDALMTASYTGVNGGLVLISADDPGMHSSQNEQDNRFYARLAKIPMLEPSDSREAKAFTSLAFDLSERFDTPVMLRLTTRVCHGKGIVELGERATAAERPYEKNTRKNVMIPAYARIRHGIVEERREKLTAFAESFEQNRVEMGDTSTGVVTSGVAYHYAREVFPGASFFKLGMTWPLPAEALKDFASKVDKLIVVEELEPYLEEQLRAMGLQVVGKDALPRQGELSPEIVRASLLGGNGRPQAAPPVDIPARPPVMCPGCPHRGPFSVLKKLHATVTGDIGCYTLSALPPLEAMDTCVCMGASIGVGQGLKRTLSGRQAQRTVAVLGDSTFIHSGIPSLVNAVYNGSDLTVLILDNRTTAMTGHQENPGTGHTLQGDPAPEVDFEGLAKSCGVGYVQTVDPIDLEETERVLREAIAVDGPSVIVARRACVLVDKEQFEGALDVDEEACSVCKLCIHLGCPAISLSPETAEIDAGLCVGCELCAQVCPTDAIALPTIAK